MILIAGPCVIESEELCMEVAAHMSDIANRWGLDYYFKASFDKANRTSGSSFRGPGIAEGLRILENVKDTQGVKILTDIHETTDADLTSQIADVIQIPALLSRQTNLIKAAAMTGKIVNIKKGQFMHPYDMIHAVTKAEATAKVGEVWVTERGTTFGYRNLVVDMRSLVMMRETRCKVIFDATHSVQSPTAAGKVSGGDRCFVAPLARAAAAVGVDGFFFETHPDPDKALSDGPNMVPLDEMGALVAKLVQISEAVKD